MDTCAVVDHQDRDELSVVAATWRLIFEVLERPLSPTISSIASVCKGTHFM